MAHYAKLNEQDQVVDILVIEWDQLQTGLWGDPASFVQCSYNTQGGEHKLGGTPVRANFPGIGYFYNRQLDIFHPPSPEGTATLNPVTGYWDRPVPRPADNFLYNWNEQTQTWDRVIV